MWDERYAGAEFAYGTATNDFLVEVGGGIKVGGSVLCLAEGEGRNATWLAEKGYNVLGVDQSNVGLQKAKTLAAKRGVVVKTECADLQNFALGEKCWDGIVSIFCHLPPPLRKKVHADIVRALVPGGLLVLEAYIPKQLDLKTGGPPFLEMLYSLDELREELVGLEFEIGREVEREIQEGQYHHGQSAVVQVLARRPS